MKEIAFTPAALRQWLKLSIEVRTRINGKLMTFAVGGSGDVKRLQGRAGSRLRVGDWRVIFMDENQRIVVTAVGSDIYG